MPHTNLMGLAMLALVAGCETMPQGPTVAAQPGADKNIAEFRTDDARCRQAARAELASASAPRVLSGTAVCPAASAVVDDRGSVAGDGIGTLIDGTDSAKFAGYGMQRRYNCAYVQCMYGRGDKVPLLARERWTAPRSPWPPDPDEYYPRLQH